MPRMRLYIFGIFGVEKILGSKDLKMARFIVKKRLAFHNQLNINISLMFILR